MKNDTGFSKSRRQKNVILSKAFEEAISAWASGSEEISADKLMNDLIYRKIKKKLEKQYPGKYVVVADGKFLGVKDSLENAWSLASPYENALVTRISKKPRHAKILGSSLRIVASEQHEI